MKNFLILALIISINFQVLAENPEPSSTAIKYVKIQPTGERCVGGGMGIFFGTVLVTWFGVLWCKSCVKNQNAVRPYR